MPPLSDPPYPFNCLLSGFASTFERYQMVTLQSPNRGRGGTSGPLWTNWNFVAVVSLMRDLQGSVHGR